MSAVIQIFEYEGNEVEFDLGSENLMVNATEMAKIFGRDLFQFTKSDHVKAFIQEALKPANAGLLGVENEADLILSKQRTGTWMHRILALKFAAWLSPSFELWVYITIDRILNTQRKELKKQAEIDAEVARLKALKYANDPEYRAILDMEEESNGYKKNRSKLNKTQYQAFRSVHKDA